MPFVTIVCDGPIRLFVQNQIKGLGGILGYNDPDRIWLEVSPKLTQPDVVFVKVHVTEEDFRKPELEHFCQALATCLGEELDKSVEVGVSVYISMAWHPTPAGALKYSDD